MKRIAICGASGIVGSRLLELLRERDCSAILVGRNPSSLRVRFPDAAQCMDWRTFEGYDSTELDAIVNLAGAGVMDKRWTTAYKRIMTSSRIESTEICARLAAENPEIRLINASAVHAYGIYPGDHTAFVEGDGPLPGGEGCYLHELIAEWERGVQLAVNAGASVALLRLGVVLDSSGATLKGMIPLFRMFLGGRHGSGRQIISWISLHDVVRAINFLLDHPEIRGPINVVSPGACTNKEVMRALGTALGRPSLVPMPALVAKLLLGPAATELILAGQRVEPKVLVDRGFDFRDREITSSLRRLLRGQHH